MELSTCPPTSPAPGAFAVRRGSVNWGLEACAAAAESYHRGPLLGGDSQDPSVPPTGAPGAEGKEDEGPWRAALLLACSPGVGSEGVGTREDVAWMRVVMREVAWLVRASLS